VLDRELSVSEVAAAHAEALDVQIHALRLRRAVLRAAAKRGSSPQEMELMHQLVKLSEVERRRIIHQFIDQTFGDLDANPDLVAMLRSAMPELSDNPIPEQVDAWVELADLVGGYAQTFGKADTPDYRSKLLIRLQIANDPRVERYWQLLATIKRLARSAGLASVFEWFIQALQHHPSP
jgi:hypothetical protein